MVDDAQLSWAEFHQRTKELQQDFELRLSQMQHAVDVARVVNVAVGILMVKFQMTEGDALNVLKKAARTQQRKLIDVAQEQIRVVEVVSNTIYPLLDKRLIEQWITGSS